MECSIDEPCFEVRVEKPSGSGHLMKESFGGYLVLFWEVQHHSYPRTLVRVTEVSVKEWPTGIALSQVMA